MNREPAKSFQDLVIWQKAHQLVLDIYRYSDRFPAKENHCLTSQIRRAAISVPANIAEGFKKRGRPDKIRFMNISQGSLEEARYYLILASDLGYGDSSVLLGQLDVVSRMLGGYIAAIKANS